MAKYDQLVKNILENIGGKENIISVTHCVTRLRFNLKDESIAKDDVLKNMDGVVTVMKTAGQYQVVIGNHVPDVYAELLKQTGINGDEGKSSANSDGNKKMSLIDKGIDILSGIMMPSIMLLCTAGIVKGFLALFVAIGFVDNTGSWYQLFYAIGDALFYFFPVILGYNAAKKFNMSPYLGLMLGAILCYPTINGTDLTFFGKVINLTYTGSVLPIIFICAAAAPLERWLKRIIPDVVKTFMVPTIVLLIMAPLGYLIIGPMANSISALLASVVNQMYLFSPILAGAFLGFFWQIFVLFGVHMVVLLPSIINLTSGTPDYIIPLKLAASFAQTGMVFAIWLKTNNKKLKDIAFPAWVSGIFGVTEPAIYGVTLPRKKYFIITCAVSGLGGALAGALKIQSFQMAGMGIFVFPGNIAPDGDLYSFFWIITICIGATILAAIIGLVVYKDEGNDLEIINTQDHTETDKSLERQNEAILAPITGVAQKLNTIEDPAFAQGLLGQGIAIDPKYGEVVAPFDGTVVTLFPTNHAIGLVSDTGCEVLIHVGMDTVQLEGKHFTSFIKQGDVVKQGDKLVNFDIDAIKKAGYSVVTPIIVTNTSDYLDIVPVAENSVTTTDQILKVMV